MDFKHLPVEAPDRTSQGKSLWARLGLGGKNSQDPEFIRHWLSLPGKS
jgi:hypothetical protein